MAIPNSHSIVPDFTRADAGLVLVTEWHTSGADQQRRAAAAALDAWRDDGGWPAGLLADCSLPGEDESTVLHYAQWSSEPRRVERVDAAVPGIEHREVTAYRRYRSTTPTTAASTTGCLVTLTVDFDAAHTR
ncbi:hypothetical protein [Actinoplanes sp. NPDC051411]|uniref:hypothetical protein n=1 Tax=Actinoplanes sp. NPDC051411 TaxID=3155522 RepID=UPI0034291328